MIITFKVDVVLREDEQWEATLDSDPEKVSVMATGDTQIEAVAAALREAARGLEGHCGGWGGGGGGLKPPEPGKRKEPTKTVLEARR